MFQKLCEIHKEKNDMYCIFEHYGLYILKKM